MRTVLAQPTNDNTGTSTAYDDQSGQGNNGNNNGSTVVSDTAAGGTYSYDFIDGANDFIENACRSVVSASDLTYDQSLGLNTHKQTSRAYVSDWLTMLPGNGLFMFGSNGGKYVGVDFSNVLAMESPIR